MPDPREATTGPQNDDDTPSLTMMEMIRHGAYLPPRADASNGIPRGMPPDKVGAVRIVVNNLDDDQNANFAFTMNGLNDPVMREVFDRYGPLIAAESDPKQRTALQRAGFVEAAAVKQNAAKSANSQAPPRAEPAADRDPYPAPAPQPSGRRPLVPVTFDLGPLGKISARYADALIQDKVLVLIGDEEGAGGMYLPPADDPMTPIGVTLPRVQEPVRVYSTGLVYHYGRLVHCVLIIDRDAE